MTDIRSVSDFLVRTLQQVDPRPLKGSELAVFARTAYPEFRPESFGCRTLRDFIRKNVPDIAEFGRAGMDVSYQLRATQEKLVLEPCAGDESTSAVYQLTTNPRLWKTFASPDSVFRLFLIPDSGMVRVLHPNAQPLPHWREIPRVSAGVLLQIGRDFAADLPDIQRSVLTPLLQEPKWWIPYFERLQSLGLKSKWIEFRRRRIREEFQRVVGGSPVTPRTTGEPIATLPPSSSEPALRSQADSIRRIAADVVQRMTESELRSLNLPLGYVMDSLTTR